MPPFLLPFRGMQILYYNLLLEVVEENFIDTSIISILAFKKDSGFSR